MARDAGGPAPRVPRGAAWRDDLRALTALAGPIILSRIALMLMGLTDAVVVGRHDATQLAYHALAWAPLAVVLTTSVGLLQGVQVMTARAIGEGRPHTAGAVLRRGLIYAAWLGCGSCVLLLAGGEVLLRALQLEERLVEGSAAALRVLALSLPPYLVSVAAQSFLEGLGRPKPGAWAGWAVNLLNLALCLLLVPGTLGLPAWGAVGAGMATVGSRIALAVFLLVYVARMADARALGVFDRAPREPAAEAEQRRIGYGGGASLFAEVSAFSGMNVVAGWLGAAQVAAWSVVLNVSAVVFMVPLGLAGATAVLVGQAYGAADRVGVRRALWTGVFACAATQAVITVAVFLAARPVAGFYTTDAALLALAAPALALATLFFVPDGVQVVLAQGLRARSDVWWPTGIHVLSYALVMLPLGWALAHPAGLGLAGIAWAVIVASLVVTAALLLRFWRVSARDRLAFAPVGAGG